LPEIATSSCWLVVCRLPLVNTFWVPTMRVPLPSWTPFETVLSAVWAPGCLSTW
jgi:hypothetical protein